MMNLEIKNYVAYLNSRKNLAPNTLKSYKADLEQFLRFLNKEHVVKLNDATNGLIVAYLESLSVSPNSLNRKITSLKEYYAFQLKNHEKININLGDIEHVKNLKKYPRIIKKEDIGRMIATCDTTPEGIRNKTIITMLYITGLRVSELIHLTYLDINLEEGYIRSVGKGNKEKIIALGELLKIVLLPYNKIRNILLHGMDSKYVFSNLEGDPLSRQSIFKIIQNAAKKADIKLHVSPHTLRHCFATHMLENGADIRSVQELLGHASISTTQIYTNITNQSLRGQYDEKFSDPFHIKEKKIMKKFKRAFVIVCDSMGIGHGKDAKQYHDEGSNTLKHIDDQCHLQIPELRSLGIGSICDITEENTLLDHSYAIALNEASLGKDTLTGHYELMGLKVTEPFKTFTDTGFPMELIEELEQLWGRKIIGNKAASGTEIIKELGEEHVKTGAVIVYTSSDSVLQICAHEDIIPVPELYKMCEQAREITKQEKYKLGRIIARPFIGTCAADFKRTPRRHDYALKPFAPTMLNKLYDAHYDVISIGKIADIFVNEGITSSTKIVSNDDGCKKIVECMKQDFNGLCFANLVDFDMEYGHRRNVVGYGKAIEDFDKYISIFKSLLKEDDILFITADHGNDPTWPGSDHTREKVPLLIYSKSFQQTGTLKEAPTFAALSSTLAEIFSVDPTSIGESFLNKLL